MTALTCAAFAGQVAVAQVLLVAKADPDLQDLVTTAVCLLGVAVCLPLAQVVASAQLDGCQNMVL